MKIYQINWDIVGSNLAIWPSPMDHDECFRKAGFKEFADSDDEWDRDFETLLERIVSLAQAYGPSKVKQFKGSRRTLIQSAHEVLQAARLDDDLGASVVEFGDPPNLTLITADQHPIIWVTPCSNLESPKALVETLARGLTTMRHPLKWRYLLPDSIPVKACMAD